MTNLLTKPDLAALVVYILGGDHKSVDTEDIAMKVNEVSPGVFVWKKYPEQINLKLIEAFLYDAKKTRCGELLIGTTRKGWRLSPKGIEWITNKGTKLIEKLGRNSSVNIEVAGTDPIRIEREKIRLFKTKAWQNWNDSKDLNLKDIHQLFRVDEYTNDQMLDNKIVRIKSLFQQDNQVTSFLTAAESVIRNRGAKK